MKQLTQDNNPSSQFSQTYWSSRIQLIIPYNCTATTVMSQWCIVMCLTHCSWNCPLLSSFNHPVLPCLPCMFSMLQCASLIWWYRRAMEFLNVSRIHHFRILNVSGKLHGNPSIHYCQKSSGNFRLSSCPTCVAKRLSRWSLEMAQNEFTIKTSSLLEIINNIYIHAVKYALYAFLEENTCKSSVFHLSAWIILPTTFCHVTISPK